MNNEVDDPFASVPLGEPWQRLRESVARRLEAQLMREVRPGHPLANLVVRAFAIHQQTDEVLFAVTDGPMPYASVHITWTENSNNETFFPATTFYASPPM